MPVMLETCATIAVMNNNKNLKGRSRGVTRVTSHPPGTAAYFMLLLCMCLVISMSFCAPPGAKSWLRSLRFPNSPPLKNPRSSNEPVIKSLIQNVNVSVADLQTSSGLTSASEVGIKVVCSTRGSVGSSHRLSSFCCFSDPYCLSCESASLV